MRCQLIHFGQNPSARKKIPMCSRHAYAFVKTRQRSEWLIKGASVSKKWDCTLHTKITRLQYILNEKLCLQCPSLANVNYMSILFNKLILLFCFVFLFCKGWMHLSICNVSLLIHSVHKFRIGIAFDSRFVLNMAKELVFLTLLAHSHTSNILQSFKTAHFHGPCFSSLCKFYTIQLVTVTSKKPVTNMHKALKQTSKQANRGVWRPSQPMYPSHLTKIPIL